jgi:uncharacterized protein YbjT (DUF2867 family)
MPDRFDSILLVGGTGKTGSRIERKLHARGIKPRIASRTPNAQQCRFDWMDPSSFKESITGTRAFI